MLSRAIFLHICAIMLGLTLAESDKFTSKTPEAIKYMMRYGYLADFGDQTEALYSKSGVKDAIKKMQHFGGLEPTGHLDNATVALFTKPRCGVADVEPSSPLIKIRTKRYAIASKGWNKRLLSYRIRSLPNGMSRHAVQSTLRKAFDVWSRISTLRFSETSDDRVDMDIKFSYEQHGDKYPFDGPGNVLAHAFFPHLSLARGGDVHFDVQEKWMDFSDDRVMNSASYSEDAVDLFTVASHEIGHALGLGHSSDPEALMFPYYKGYTDSMDIIGNDDILAMKALYTNKDTNSVRTTRRPTSTRATRRPITRRVTRRPITRRNTRRPITRRTTRPTITRRATRPPITRRVTRPTSTQRFTVPHPRRRVTRHPTRRSKRRDRPQPTRATTRNSPKTDVHIYGALEMPNLCEGSFDAMSVIRGELMIFKKNFMWRFRAKGQLNRGFPVEFTRFFYKFPKEIKKIDAVYERTIDSNIIFFTGARYWIYDGTNFIDDSPRPLSDLGLPSNVQGIDAALHRSKEKATYLFCRNEYYKLDEKTGRLSSNVPVRLTRRSGIQSSIDNAFEWMNGQTYVLKGKHFWLLDEVEMKVKKQFLYEAPKTWGGCQE